MAHAYHTKVPHPAIMRYILHYTEPGDIVFDGFCGTGMTGVAANICGLKTDVDALKEKSAKIGTRHGICSDLSPIATLISANYNLTFDSRTFEQKTNAILDQVENELGWMYETVVNGVKAKINYTIWSDIFICPSCGNELVFWDIATNDEYGTSLKDSFNCPTCGTLLSKLELKNAKETIFDNVLNHSIVRNKIAPVRINFSSCQYRGEKNLDTFDKNLISMVDKIHANKNLGIVPKGDETSRTYDLGISHIHQLFTHRNYICLNKIYEKVKNNRPLLTWFTSSLQNCSKMWKFKPDRKGGTLSGTFYVPSLGIEQNPINVLRRKIKSFISMNYDTSGNSIISLNSATKLSTLESNKIDYIFTDPPFGANLMYSELNSLWEGWLSVKTNDSEEAIVNKTQNKDLFDYQQLMNTSFKEYFRVLKPGKWMTIEFSNTSASVWNAIQNALQGVGFVVANVAALDKKQGSFKAVTTTTAVKQDLVITCFKPSEQMLQKFNESQNVQENVWDFVDEYLQHLPVHIEKGNATTTIVERSPKILYDRLITYYVQRGFPVPLDAVDFQAGLRERYIEKDGMFFTADQAAEYEEKKKDLPGGVISMGIIVSSEADGIQWLRNQLTEAPKTYQELQPGWMQAINGVRKGDILPELSDLLEENFIKQSDSKWRLPDVNDERDLETLRTKSLLKEFKLYVDIANKPKGKIKEARVEALRAGFKQCYNDKDFATIIHVGDKIPQNLLMEDEVLLQYYDIAINRM